MRTRQNASFAAFAAVAAFALLGVWRVAGTAAAGPSLVHDAAVPPASAGGPVASSEVASASAQPREVAGPARARSLVVVDAESREPLAAAVVQWQTLDGASTGRSSTTRDGASNLVGAPDAALLLTLRAPAYVPMRGVLAGAPATAVIAMERGGDLVVDVVDADGRPVAGVGLGLLPPRLAGAPPMDARAFAAAPAAPEPPFSMMQAPPEFVSDRGVYHMAAGPAPADRAWGIDARWHAVVRRGESDAAGRVCWQGLPFGDGYRFAVLPPRHGEPEPPHEQQRLTIGPAGITVGSAPQSGVSGKFTIAAAAPTRLRAVVTSGGTLRGRFRTGLVHGVPARLFRITQAGGGDLVPVTALDIAAVTTTSDDGRFEFRNVRPGDHALRSCWLSDGMHVHFASVTVRIPPGRDIDLGDIAPTTGHTVTVEVGVEGVDGTELGCEQVFADSGRAAAGLLLDVVPDSESLADSLNELSTVPIGVPLVLHGLPPGRLELTVMPPAMVLPTLPDVVELMPGATGKHTLPQSETLRPRLRVERGHAVRLACMAVDGTLVAAPTILTRHCGDGRIESHAAGPAAATDELELRLRPGQYELFVAVQSHGGAQCAMATLVNPARDPAPIPVQLRDAARVRGRLLDADGSAARNVRLQWTLPGWVVTVGTWPFAVVTDAEGGFELPCVPPGVQLQPGPGTPPLPALVSGDNTVTIARS